MCNSQRGALLCETVPCDAMTSGFVSDLFTVRLDDKGQLVTVHFVEKGQTKHFDEKHFFSNRFQVYNMLHLKKIKF